MDDPLCTLSIDSVSGREIILDNPDTPTIRHFGGIVTDVDTIVSGTGRRYDCTAQSWAVLLGRTEVTKNYYQASYASDKAIIQDAFTVAELAEIDTSTNVDVGRAIAVLKFNHDTLLKVMETIADITGMVWWVDHFKKLWYKHTAAVLCPFDLNSTPNAAATPPSYGYSELVVSKDITAVVNKVVVRGGLAYTADRIVTEHAGDGASKIIKVKEINAAPSDADRIQVWVWNTGTSAWDSKTVGVFPQDALSGYDCLWKAVDMELEFNTAPPSVAEAVKVRGRKQYPIYAQVVSQDSIDQFGRVYTFVYPDKDILTEDMAYDKAQAILRERAFGQIRLTLTIDKDGLQVGMLIKVVNAIIGLSGYYSIKRLSTRLVGAELASYKVILTNPAKLYPDAIDMLAAGWRAGMPYVEVQDERLHIYRDYTEPTISLTDVALDVIATGIEYYVDPVVGDHDPIIAGFWKVAAS